MFVVDFLVIAVVIVAFCAVAQMVVYPRLERRELDAFLDDVLDRGAPPEA